MAWNEPPRDRDPWGNRGGNQGPPDLDEVVRRLQARLGGLFGGRRRSGKGGDGDGAGAGGGSRGGGPGSAGISLIVALVAVLWLVYDSIYIIEPAERGVVLRFGRYVDTLLPGPIIRWPRPIEQVIKLNVDQVRSTQHESAMLTQDENIVDIRFAVQYRIKDARNYLFNVTRPDETLQQAAQSAVREVVGKSQMDFIITEGRDAIAARARELTQEILDRYETGLNVVGVALLEASPPEQVKAAFDDAIKAREDEQRLKNEAESYANEVVPKARGGAARAIEEAQAYKARAIAEAEGETDRFLAILAEYEQAPEVTRERLYLETMQDVLARTGKVFLDAGPGSDNVLYLPLDRMLRAPAADPGAAASTEYRTAEPDAAADTLLRSPRGREPRR